MYLSIVLNMVLAKYRSVEVMLFCISKNIGKNISKDSLEFDSTQLNEFDVLVCHLYFSFACRICFVLCRCEMLCSLSKAVVILLQYSFVVRDQTSLEVLHAKTLKNCQTWENFMLV